MRLDERTADGTRIVSQGQAIRGSGATLKISRRHQEMATSWIEVDRIEAAEHASKFP
jgi:hypothetical protein